MRTKQQEQEFDVEANAVAVVAEANSSSSVTIYINAAKLKQLRNAINESSLLKCADEPVESRYSGEKEYAGVVLKSAFHHLSVKDSIRKTYPEIAVISQLDAVMFGAIETTLDKLAQTALEPVKHKSGDTLLREFLQRYSLASAKQKSAFSAANTNAKSERERA